MRNMKKIVSLLLTLMMIMSLVATAFAEGDVVLEAKTTKLAKHYEQDFGAVQIPAFQTSAPRYLIADDAAKQIFFTYLV